MTSTNAKTPNNIPNIKLNVGVMYGGGQIPEANQLMGKLIEKFLQINPFDSVYGIHRSYEGLADSDCYELMTEKKAEKIQTQIGTYFETCRNFDPSSEENFPAILEQLKAHQISVLVVCGGDGSARAAADLEKKLKEVNYFLNIFWVPCTIDGINGTESIGFKTAVQQSFERAIYVAANAWSTFDHGMNGPRVAVIEVMGRNRDDILIGVMQYLKDVGEIGKYDLSEFLAIAIPSAHEWSISELVTKVNNSERPTVIIASEGAKPKEGWTEESGSCGVAKKIATLIELEKKKRVNSDVIGYLSQSNPYGMDVLGDTEFNAWVNTSCTCIIVCTMSRSEEALAIVKKGIITTTIPLKYITFENPNSKDVVPLSEEVKEFLSEFLI